MDRIAVAGNEKALRANAAAFAAAVKMISATPGAGSVSVSRIFNGVTTVESYAIAPPAAKKTKTDPAPVVLSSIAVWKTKEFGAKAKLVRDIGAANIEAVLTGTIADKGTACPATNHAQSLSWQVFRQLNELEQARVVTGARADELLPTMRNYVKFLALARSIVGRLPVDDVSDAGDEAEAEAEAEEEVKEAEAEDAAEDEAGGEDA